MMTGVNMKGCKLGLNKMIVLMATAFLCMCNIGGYRTLNVRAEDAAVAKDTVQMTLKDDTEEFAETREFVFDELADNDVLLMDYIDRQFFGDEDTTLSEYGMVGDKKLTNGNEKKIYRELKASVEKIANGTRRSSVIEVGGLRISLSGWEKSVRKVMSYLMMDCPYDLYWFDKNAALVSVKGYGSTINTVTFSFTVALEYQGDTAYMTDSAKIGAAKKAVSNAKTIVEEHAGESDREKLSSYCREICDLVSYNTKAAYSDMAYGNPWQLIWVFDGNPSTKVVCEGYAKAFQYLCDLSVFESGTVCYTVTGVMGDGVNSENHMWNIVTLNGENYLVDVTNCDTGGVGSDGSLFLAKPKSGTVKTGYTFLNSKKRSVMYAYDSDSKSLLGKSILKLNDEKDELATVLSLNGQKLKNDVLLKVTNGKKYSFKASVTDAAGKRITGSGGKVTWSTSNKKIASVTSSGKVTVKKKAGTVTITAKAADGSAAKVRLKAGKSAVKAVKVKIVAEKRTMYLSKDKTQTLKAIVKPASAAVRKVTWKSSNKKIAVVNSKGKVTAKKSGTVKITAIAKDGSKKKAVITIKIKKK